MKMQLVATIMAAVLLFGVGIPASGQETHWPTDTWSTSTPEKQGIDSALLADMLAFIQQENLRMHSVQIIRNGYLVMDTYIYPFHREARHALRSCTKSTVSSLIGIAIDQGYIESVDQRLLDLLPGRTFVNMDTDKGSITLKHSLTMASGLECRDSYLYNWQGLDAMRASEDWVQFTADLPMEHEPGTHFEYCNGVSHMLSAIISQTTGMSALEFAKVNLFAPLGVSDVVWLSDPQGITIGWSRLHLRPLDMAKIGYLFLNEGIWDGEQIISAEWIAESTRPYIETGFPDEYGYQWWVDHQGRFYFASGYGGQLIVVFPEQNMVVVITSGDGFWSRMLLEEYIIPAAVSDEPLPENLEADARLDVLSQQLEQDPEPTAPPTTWPDLAHSISGQTFRLDENPLEWESFSVQFEEGSAAIEMTFTGDIKLELPIGLYNRFLFTSIDATWLGKMPVTDALGLRGSWEDDNTLIINLQALGGSEDVWIELSFYDTGAFVHLEESTSRTILSLAANLVES